MFQHVGDVQLFMGKFLCSWCRRLGDHQLEPSKECTAKLRGESPRRGSSNPAWTRQVRASGGAGSDIPTPSLVERERERVAILAQVSSGGSGGKGRSCAVRP